MRVLRQNSRRATALALVAAIAAIAAIALQAAIAQAPGGTGPKQAGAQNVARHPITREDLRRWADAWNSHDIQRVLDLFDPAVVIHQPSNPKPLDFDGARNFFGMIFKAYPDFHVEVTDAVIEELTAVSIERVTGTWLGGFTDPATGKTTAGNGRKFDHPGVMVIKYGPDHRIRSVDIYWDRLVVNQQLGLAN